MWREITHYTIDIENVIVIRPFIEFSDFSEFMASDKLLKHELGSI